MSENSLIEWTDATWNPLLGCDKCSEGCKLCYAIRTAWRLQHNPNPKVASAYAGLVEQRADGSLNWTGKINLLPERLREPMGWKKPRRIFVNSQSDLFHEAVPDSFIDQVFAVMALCPHHTFQVLTKRPDRMREYLEAKMPWPNVWLGTSVENQKAADARIPALLATPAAVRFLSCEPLLGPLDLMQHYWCAPIAAHLAWLICGGESGPGARPMHPEWARSLRDQCAAAGVPFFFKQWGEWLPLCGLYDEDRDEKEDGSTTRVEAVESSGHIPDGYQPNNSAWLMDPVGKKAAGRLLDGVEHSAFPMVPAPIGRGNEGRLTDRGSTADRAGDKA